MVFHRVEISVISVHSYKNKTLKFNLCFEKCIIQYFKKKNQIEIKISDENKSKQVVFSSEYSLCFKKWLKCPLTHSYNFWSTKGRKKSQMCSLSKWSNTASAKSEMH